MDGKIDIGRRHLLRLFAGTATTGLAGCCCRGWPDRVLFDPSPAAATVKPILRPVKLSRKQGPPGAKHLVDVHTHFFNASDANVKGYYQGGIIRNHVPDALKGLANLLAPLIDDLSERAPTAQDEYRYLVDAATLPGGTKDGVSKIRADMATHRDEVSTHLWDALKDRKDIKAEFQRLRGRNLSANYSLTLSLQGLSADKESELSEQALRTMVDPVRRRQRRHGLDRFMLLKTQGLDAPDVGAGGSAPRFRQPSPAEADPGGLFEFIGHMLSRRSTNMLDYQTYYTEDEDSPAIDGVIASMVDFDYWLDCPTESQREDQARLHGLLSLLSGGWMLPIVPYNPWTDIERPVTVNGEKSGASFELVQKAVREYGFVGVKIYPPNGFYPYGNADRGMQVCKASDHPGDKSCTSQRRPDDHLQALDDNLLRLFEWCSANDVPVQAHTDESMGADFAADDFTSPKGWTALLDKLKASGKAASGHGPIINFGHFGGDRPGKDHPTNEWPEALAKLARHPLGDRLYADIAFWDGLCGTCGTTAQTDTEEAMKRLKRALYADPGMSRRIMYGTDWHMTSSLGDWPSYLNEVIANVSALGGELPLNDLFYENAVRCFGLGKNGAQRERILARLEGVEGGVAPWLRDA
jgi:predicted TIM-barrel fold metal-dependent hydrolase